MNAFDLMRTALEQAREAALQGHAADAVFHAQAACELATNLGDLPQHAEAASVLAQQLFYLGRFE